MILPADYNLPHTTWLPNQLEAVEICVKAYREAVAQDETRFVVVEMPTGGGKTGLAAALTTLDTVTYYASTLALLDQIEANYDFKKLKGKNNYPCQHAEKINTWRADRHQMIPMASDCHISPMKSCEYAYKCDYLIATKVALDSHKTACTPQMGLFHRGIQKRRGIVVLDEAHMLGEVIRGFIQFEISADELREHGLPLYPYQEGYGELNQSGLMEGGLMDDTACQEVEHWLDHCISILDAQVKRNDPLMPLSREAQRFLEKLQRLSEVLPITGKWFLRTGDELISRKGKKLPGLILQPMTARSIAPRLWGGKGVFSHEEDDLATKVRLVVLMSATIGDPEPLMDELGIREYQFFSFPHPVPVEARRIYNLHFEKMTKRNLDANPGLYQRQAFAIANWIKKLPSDYRGLIVTPSYKKIEKLQEFLPKYLPGRVWKPPQGGISERIQAFLNDPTPGLVWIETLQGAGTGFDGRDDILRFVVIAGADHPNPTDPVTKALMSYNWSYQMALVANEIMQAAGRAGRSEHRDRMSPEVLAKFQDYDFTEDGYLKSFVALADGSITTKIMLNRLSQWFKDAML